MLKKISVTLLSFTFIAILSGCEAFRKPNPDSADSAEGAIEEYTENEEALSENTAEGGKEESTAATETPSENPDSSSETSTSAPKTELKTEVKTEVKSELKTEETPKETSKKESTKSEVKTFTITAKQFEFSPSSITVNEGDTVRISVKTEDVAHGLVIPDFGINKVVNPGSTVTIEFVADKKGTFPFRCSVFCGEGHGGMTGNLIVK